MIYRENQNIKLAKSMGQKNGDKNTGPETGDREEGDS